MPQKFNVDRRDKFPEAKFAGTNWPDYNEALRRRGDVAFWLEDGVDGKWSAPMRKGSAQPIYSGHCQLMVTSFTTPTVLKMHNATGDFLLVAQRGPGRFARAVDTTQFPEQSFHKYFVSIGFCYVLFVVDFSARHCVFGDWWGSGMGLMG